MKYRVTGYVSLPVVTIVEAKSMKEAEQLAADRDLNICIHGSEYAEGEADHEEWVAVDGTSYDCPIVDDVMKLKDWKQ